MNESQALVGRGRICEYLGIGKDAFMGLADKVSSSRTPQYNIQKVMIYGSIE